MAYTREEELLQERNHAQKRLEQARKNLSHHAALRVPLLELESMAQHELARLTNEIIGEGQG